MVSKIGFPVGVYLAGRLSRRAELRQYAREMPPYCYCTALWLQNDKDNVPLIERSAARAVAIQDMNDVLDSEVVIVFPEGPGVPTTGGRNVEFGIAIGLEKIILMVGPVENVFGWLPQVSHFTTWSGALDYLHSDAFRDRVFSARSNSVSTDKA